MEQIGNVRHPHAAACTAVAAATMRVIANGVSVAPMSIRFASVSPMPGLSWKLCLQNPDA
ncbi:hypothetical protein [Burkholderia sp. GS2Y]|uniref:Uncharacterized protein n=1 Tax=Burkholderia theae TaxID=3143496 RepID=A0ABU9WLX1_9BURK